MEFPTFELCVAALEKALATAFPETRLSPFGADTLNPGVKADLQAGRGMANIHLWHNLSFDVDAIENVTGRVLLHSSNEDVTPSDVASTIAELAAALR